MLGIADMVERLRTTAQDVSTVAAEMQATSQTLCREITDIVRKAVKADLREYPRYEVKLATRLEHHAAFPTLPFTTSAKAERASISSTN